MTEQKRNPNPFIRAAQEAKAKQIEEMKQNTIKASTAPKKVAVPKTGASAGGTKVMKKVGRGG
jgi:hypothetical protein